MENTPSVQPALLELRRGQRVTSEELDAFLAAPCNPRNIVFIDLSNAGEPPRSRKRGPAAFDPDILARCVGAADAVLLGAGPDDLEPGEWSNFTAQFGETYPVRLFIECRASRLGEWNAALKPLLREEQLHFQSDKPYLSRPKAVAETEAGA